MKKETIIGVVLIALVLIGFFYLNRSPQEASQAKNNRSTSDTLQNSLSTSEPEVATLPVEHLATKTDDSTTVVAKDYFGQMQATGEETVIKLENDKVKLEFSTRGGVPISAQLKEFNNLKGEGKNKESEPLYLFQRDNFNLNFIFRTTEGKILESRELLYTSVPTMESDSTVTMRLLVDSAAYLDFTYTLHKDDYRLSMTISGKQLERFFPSNMRYLDFEMGQKMAQLEKSWVNENTYTGIFYKFLGDDVERLKETKQTAGKELKQPLNWVAFKDKFFATVLIAERKNGLEAAKIGHTTYPKESEYTKELSFGGSVPFDNREGSAVGFTLYFGPLEHHLLKDYDQNVSNGEKLQLEQLVYVGGSVFRWINLFMIIPLVDFLRGFLSNWGIIILLLTLVIKLLLSPLTFKSYMSQAKMKVLKPQVATINAQYPGSDQKMQLKRSQETMALYRNAGASPMSGCLPMLLQMPFLIALYMYFPTSIYLRGESFLWANDLSSYDAVLSWDFNIPILSGLMGNHISLFCLLWAIANILYSRYTMGQSAMGGDNSQMKMMKWMPYMMSIMFFFFFNNNASGLCYYYFISTLITILQFLASRLLINEEKVLARLEENKKKPKKKSGFMARLEEAQRLQQKGVQEQQKKRR